MAMVTVMVILSRRTPPPATNIQVIDVTIDQGIRVPVALNSSVVAQANYNVDVLKDRPGYMRAFYMVADGWTDRNIYAIATIAAPGLDPIQLEDVKTAYDYECGNEAISLCRYQGTANSFNFAIPAEYMQPGLQYKVELFEAAPGHQDDPSVADPVFPSGGGSNPIHVDDSYMKMRVVLVPVYHNVGNDCPAAPDMMAEYAETGKTKLDIFGEQLLAHNPADEVEMILHDTMNWSGSLQNGSLLSGLQQLRAQENAPPEYYYYAVADPCNGNPDFGGIAQLGGPTKNAASQRVGWGRLVWLHDGHRRRIRARDRARTRPPARLLQR